MGVSAIYTAAMGQLRILHSSFMESVALFQPETMDVSRVYPSGYMANRQSGLFPQLRGFLKPLVPAQYR